MKTTLLSLVGALFLVFTANATVRTVANFPPGSAQYPDVQSAVTAASAGDTIYINGSPTAYNSGGVNINKRLVFVGTGYHDSAEGNLSSMISGTVILDTVTTIPRSGSSGCQFIGIYFEGNVYTGNENSSDPSYPVNIFFSGCAFAEPLQPDNDGWVIQNCMFSAGNNSAQNGINFYSNYTTINSCIIQNCFFAYSYDGYAIYFDNTTLASGLIIDHNFFENRFAGSVASYAIISNNVFFFANAVGSTNLQNCQISNNLFYSNPLDSLPTGTGGTANTVFNNYVTGPNNYQFVGNTVSATITYPNLLADNWQLTASSLGHNKATDNTDCGPFGGSYPINMNGSPIPPQMFQMNTSSLVPINDTLKVQFEARQQKQ